MLQVLFTLNQIESILRDKLESVFFSSCGEYLDYLRDLQLDNAATRQHDVGERSIRAMDGEYGPVAYIKNRLQAKTLGNLVLVTQN